MSFHLCPLCKGAGFVPSKVATSTVIRAGKMVEVTSVGLAPIDRRMFSIAKVCKIYGVSRVTVKRFIRRKKLPAVVRRTRGGQMGQFMHLKDCDKVFLKLRKQA